MASPAPRVAVRGEILHFLADPALAAPACEHYADGLLVIANGRVVQTGAADAVLAALPPGTPVTDYRGKLVLPGFVDTHIHYPQTDVIASYGEQLLPWLERYTFPAEARFADPSHARTVAGFFLDELLANGTTTAAIYATVHPDSVDAIFEAAAARNMRIAAGKVMMDRNAPANLRDTAQSSHADCAALIARWHGRGRASYAVTPRFALTSTEAQLAVAGELAASAPGVLVQTHMAENADEVRAVAAAFPWSRSYLDVYERFGLVRPGAIYAHCIHLQDAEWPRIHAGGSAIAFCPTSNLFLGSGLFDLERACGERVPVGIGTDVGAGTSFSMLRTLSEAYKVAALRGQRLTALRAFYLATLAGARALALDAHIGSFRPGCEADFIVLDPQATPLIARRMAAAGDLAERLFVWMTLADDRAVHATWVAGVQAQRRA